MNAARFGICVLGIGVALTGLAETEMGVASVRPQIIAADATGQSQIEAKVREFKALVATYGATASGLTLAVHQSVGVGASGSKGVHKAGSKTNATAHITMCKASATISPKDSAYLPIGLSADATSCTKAIEMLGKGAHRYMQHPVARRH